MASSDSAGETIAESPPSTPFHAVVEECEATPIESPFFPATPESGPVAAASPFVKVAEAELIAFEASVQGAPAAVPKPVSSEPEVAVDRHVIRGQVATACGLGLTQLNHVDKIHIVPDDRRVAEALRDLLLAEGFQSEITDSVPPNACAAIVMSGLSEITSLD
ncbi:MAG: hypothetical protein P1U82_00125 [Verrucomicrobiales bacterium]|jgi:hypothetical protein|nr:hypothetical protein [Verrucomicrobiales bacterium]